MAKGVASLALVVLAMIVGYLNMTLAWGLELRSPTAFITCFVAMAVIGVLQVLSAND